MGRPYGKCRLKEGMTITGLTTAASLWVASIIGILTGLGFYATAIVLTFLSAACMLWGSRLEHLLPTHPTFLLTVTFLPGFIPKYKAIGIDG